MKIGKEQLEDRLKILEAELEKGTYQLARLDQSRLETQHTVLRISGAIQVVRELLELGAEVPESRQAKVAAVE